MPLRLLILMQPVEHLPQPEHRLDIPFPFHSCWRFSTMLPRRLQRATKPGPTAKKRRQESAKRGEYLAEPEDGLDIVRLLGEDFLAALPRLHELIQLRIDR